MPRKPRTAAKKQWKRRPRRSYPTFVNRSLQPVPQRSIVHHKFALAPSTTTSGFYSFNLNNMWDPDRSSLLGGQPYARDTFASLYNKYRVIGAKYTVEVSSNSATVLLGTLVTNEPFAYTAVGGDFNELKVLPRARFVTQAPGGPIRKIHGYANCASVLGQTRAQYMASEETSAQVDNNPIENCILQIAVASVSGVPLVGASLNVMIEYITEWFDPKTLGPS